MNLTSPDLEEEMDGHTLAEAELTGTYHRNGDGWPEHSEEDLGAPPPPGYIGEE